MSIEKSDILDAAEPDISIVPVVDDNAVAANRETPSTVRGLKPRHIQLMGISGAIGTGLFVGTGSSLARAGPLSLLLGYSLYAFLFYTTFGAMGEMVTWLPVNGSFILFAKRYVDDSFAFALGWLYAYNSAAVVAAEVVAAASLINYWNTSVNNAVWCSIILASYFVLNVSGVRIYGEGEFFLSMFKVLLIIGLLFFTVITMSGGNPANDAFGFRYWKNPGAMAEYLTDGSLGRFAGLWATFVQAAYSFGGPDYIALAAGETKSPRRVLPSVFNRVLYRIVIFYVGGVLAVGILVPYNDPALTESLKGAGSSPFVIAAVRLGIPALPSIINAVVMTSAWSCGLEVAFATSRSLYAMSLSGSAPRFLSFTWRGVPVYCVTFVCAVGCLSFLSIGTNSTVVFTWITSLSGSCGFLIFGCFNLIYLRFHYAMRAQGVERSSMPYSTRGQVYRSWIAVIAYAVLFLTNGFAVFVKGNWDLDSFIFAYLSLPALLLPYFGHKIWKRQSFWPTPLAAVDLFTGKAQIDEEELDDQVDDIPTTKAGKFQRWMWG